jgi:hypothetical protein
VTFYPDINPGPGEGHIIISPIAASEFGQGTWEWASSSTYSYYTMWYNTSNGDGDNLSFKVFLAKGTYILRLVTIKDTNRGILDFDLDGVEIASFDLYGAFNNVILGAGFVVAESGLKTLKARVDGKNASSSGYFGPITMIGLFRTA